MWRRINDTLFELMCGIFLWCAFWQAAGVWFVPDKARCSLGLWFGALTAEFCVIHMYRALDRALDFVEKDAQKYVMSRSMMRYGLIIAVFLILEATGAGNILCFALGLMGLKAAAYLQPFMHRALNGIKKRER